MDLIYWAMCGMYMVGSTMLMEKYKTKYIQDNGKVVDRTYFTVAVAYITSNLLVTYAFIKLLDRMI